MSEKPKMFEKMKSQYPDLVTATEAVGKAVRNGPLDEKTGHLIQLAAAAAMRSEGAVHSHVKRAAAAGASAEEIEHAIVLLTSTIGFPQVAAAMSWAGDVLLPS